MSEALNKIQALMREKRFEEAIQLCCGYIEHWPPNERHEAYSLRSDVNWRLGSREQAIEDIEIAIRLAKSNPGHRYCHMIRLIDLGRYDLAIEECEALLEMEREREFRPFSDSAQFHKAFALMMLKRMSQASSVLELIKDEAPIWVAGRLWSKSELLEMTKSQSS